MSRAVLSEFTTVENVKPNPRAIIISISVIAANTLINFAVNRCLHCDYSLAHGVLPTRIAQGNCPLDVQSKQ